VVRLDRTARRASVATDGVTIVARLSADDEHVAARFLAYRRVLDGAVVQEELIDRARPIRTCPTIRDQISNSVAIPIADPCEISRKVLVALEYAGQAAICTSARAAIGVIPDSLEILDRAVSIQKDIHQGSLATECVFPQTNR
jgi:hypothetical protein